MKFISKSSDLKIVESPSYVTTIESNLYIEHKILKHTNEQCMMLQMLALKQNQATFWGLMLIHLVDVAFL